MALGIKAVLLTAATAITVADVAFAAGLPVPSSPTGQIDVPMGTTRLAGQFERGDGVCRVTVAAEGLPAVEASIKAGGKTRVNLGGREVEVFCCRELKLVTLREVRRHAELTN